MTADSLLKHAIQAALDAGSEILKIYESDDFAIDYKADDSPLTRADLASHFIIDSQLKSTGIPILSEEGKHMPYDERRTWNALWIIDPIDGTKEFIKKNGEFTVNIALVERGVPILGVVYVPVLHELYYAAREIGSFKAVCTPDASLEKIFSRADKLPLEGETRPFTVVASRSHLTPETEIFVEELRLKHGELSLVSRGSSLKLCMVAEGSADCYPRFAPTMEWDTAAGHAICLYAGCEVIDMETRKEMIYNRENLLNNWFLVRSGSNAQ